MSNDNITPQFDADGHDALGYDKDGEKDYALDDVIADHDFADHIVTNDAVAGETVWPGAGDGNDGPTGGSPGEASPTYDEHDRQDDPFDSLPNDDDFVE